MPILLTALAILFVLVSSYIWWISRTVDAPIDLQIQLDTATSLAEVKLIGPPVTLKLSGNIPKEIYVNNSHIISLQGEAFLNTEKADPNLGFPKNLEVQLELIAPKFDVDGDERQKRSIPHNKYSTNFNWGISPKVSGQQQIGLITYWLNDGREYDISSKIFKVKVKEFLGLTSQQLFIFRAVSALLTVVTIIAGLCINLGTMFIDWLGLTQP